eukprot:755797-Hanusia_phi.AAC.7
MGHENGKDVWLAETSNKYVAKNRQTCPAIGISHSRCPKQLELTENESNTKSKFDQHRLTASSVDSVRASISALVGTLSIAIERFQICLCPSCSIPTRGSRCRLPRWSGSMR